MSRIFPRPPAQIMAVAKLGCYYANFLSFSRGLLRKMQKQQWQITLASNQLNAQGYGRVIYQINTSQATYQALCLSRPLDDDLRSDRVIATQWDMCAALVRGQIEPELLADIESNLPHQEQGRYSDRVISITRANRSKRNFDYVLGCLQTNRQPELKHIEQVGYLARTTAVYGNGKFGLADFFQLADTDMQAQYHAQMLMVYIIRMFTLHLVEHIAAQSTSNGTPPKLDQSVARYFGIGNSTGLGMVPFLLNHPKIIDSWVKARELALADIFDNAHFDNLAKKRLETLLLEAIEYFKSAHSTDSEQQQINQQIATELEQFNRNGYRACANYQLLYLEHIVHNNLSYSSQELILNLLLEIHPHISERYCDFAMVSEDLPNISKITVAELLELIERTYAWVLQINFTDQQNTANYWYASQDKQEPRLGARTDSYDETFALKVDIAKQVSQLYHALSNLAQLQLQQPLTQWLVDNRQYTWACNRVIASQTHPYGEIHCNLLGADCKPLQLLKFKLAFLGAMKFDPKSDRWLRITLFQGAPLPNHAGYLPAYNVIEPYMQNELLNC